MTIIMETCIYKASKDDIEDMSCNRLCPQCLAYGLILTKIANIKKFDDHFEHQCEYVCQECNSEIYQKAWAVHDVNEPHDLITTQLTCDIIHSDGSKIERIFLLDDSPEEEELIYLDSSQEEQESD